MDTARLRGIIAERGFSQREVARRIGMTEKTFYTKMKNGVFGIDEADRMIALLNIDNPGAIFFEQDVTSKVTSVYRTC